jgi:hypothetical protein
MNSKLNVKQWIIAAIAVFVFSSIWNFLVARLIMAPSYPSLFPAPPESADVMTQRVLIYLARAITALLFVYVFTRGYEGKPGVGEGLRYGLLIGLLIQVPGVFYSQISSGFPTGFVVLRGVFGLADQILSGTIVGMIYKGQPKPAA